MKKIFIIAGLFLFFFVEIAISQEIQQQNIFESLSKPDSVTKAKVIIHQDERIEQLLLNNKNSNRFQGQQNLNGYRVQVFSSNTQRTAKNEAFKIEKQIREMFPNEEVYVNYTSPFWKVRVGDFDTMGKAQAFRLQLIEVFPEIKSETYVVRDQVQFSGSK